MKLTVENVSVYSLVRLCLEDTENTTNRREVITVSPHSHRGVSLDLPLYD
jgi:hypothetical protein